MLKTNKNFRFLDDGIIIGEGVDPGQGVQTGGYSWYAVNDHSEISPYSNVPLNQHHTERVDDNTTVTVFCATIDTNNSALRYEVVAREVIHTNSDGSFTVTTQYYHERSGFHVSNTHDNTKNDSVVVVNYDRNGKMTGGTVTTYNYDKDTLIDSNTQSYGAEEMRNQISENVPRYNSYFHQGEPPAVTNQESIPVAAPATEAPPRTPVTEAPTIAPATEAPTIAPVTEAPTIAPVTEAPTIAPVTEAPTIAPETEAPTVAPETEAPTIAPVTEAPTAGEPVTEAGTLQEAPGENTTGGEAATEAGTTQDVPAETTTETGTQEPVTEAGTQEPATETGTQEAATETGTQEPATETGTQEAATETGTQEPATEAGTQEPATEAGTQEAATETGTQEAATETGTQEPATETGTQEPATETGTQEAATETGTQEPATETGTQEPVTETGTQEPVTETGTSQEPTTAGPPRDPSTEPYTEEQITNEDGDPVGTKRTYTDEDGTVTRTESYDNDGNMTNSETYENGRLTSSTDYSSYTNENNQVINKEVTTNYDENNQVASTSTTETNTETGTIKNVTVNADNSYSESITTVDQTTGDTKTVTKEYDSDQKLLSTTETNTTIDKENVKRTTIETKDAAGKVTKKVSLTEDQDNNITREVREETKPDGTVARTEITEHDGVSRKVRTETNESGNLVKTTVTDNGKVRTTEVYEYDKEGKPIGHSLISERKNADGTITRVIYKDDETITQTYDADGETLISETKSESLKKYTETHPSKGDGTLGSDLSYVSDSMGSLKGKIKEHTDLNHEPNSDHDAAVIGAMYGAANYFGSATNSLYANLSAEADAIYGIANLIFQMDQSGALLADSTLTDGIKGLYGNVAGSIEMDRLQAASDALKLSMSEIATDVSGKYKELADTLGATLTSGKAGRISVADITAAASAITSQLDTEIATAKELESGVTDFMTGIGASNTLQGGPWEDVNKNLQEYQNLLHVSGEAAEFLKEAIQTAMGIIVDYMGDEYTELDDSKLEESETQLIKLKNDLDTAQAAYDAAKTCSPQTEKRDESGKIIQQAVKCADVGECLKTLNNAKDAWEKMNKLVEKLRGLAPVLEAAQKVIEDAVSQIRGALADPTAFMNSNAGFKLTVDLSAFGIDSSKDYKKILNDFLEKIKTETGTGNPGEQSTAGGTEPGTGTESPTNSPTDPDPETPWSGDPGGGGPSKTDPPTDAPTEAPTEKPTEEPTVTPTETTTGSDTEPETSTPTESPTETQTETPATPTEAPTSGGGKKPGKGGGGGGSSKKPKPGVETEPLPIEIPTEEIPTIIDDPIIEPDTDIYYEPELEPEDEIIIDDSIIIPTDPPKKSNGIKTMGIAAGIGLAVGASALGAHTIIKSREEDDEDTDYGYEK